MSTAFPNILGIKEHLHQVLDPLFKNIDTCAFLDYPDYLNPGDHVIWVSSLLYLTETRKTNIDYCASLINFDGEEMKKRIGKAPIILQGGGNLGDLWSDCQLFREQIIGQFTDRQIIILPQSIYFTEASNLKRAKEIFNKHPALTIIAREQHSYEIAKNEFTNCRILLAPDMSFHLAGSIPHLMSPLVRKPLGYLLRQDKESNNKSNQFTDHQAAIPKTPSPQKTIEDWHVFDWVYTGRGGKYSSSTLPWKLPGYAWLVREGWQRGLRQPRSWLSRRHWNNQFFKDQFNNKSLMNLPSPELHKFSWDIVHDAFWQINNYNSLVTDRLHAHILASLLEIPNTLLSNAYHKNESFFQTWSKSLPSCNFRSSPVVS